MLPELTIKITADPKEAKDGLSQVDKAITQTGGKASTATSKTARLSGGLKNLGNVSNATRAKIQNTSFQLSDFIVQVQGGTSASRALSQQLPQLLGAFGAMGAVLGVAAGIGIPAVTMAMQALGKESIDLGDQMDALSEAVEEYQSAAALASLSTDDLTARFGVAGEAASEIAEFMSEWARIDAVEAMSAAVKTLADDFGGLGGEMIAVTDQTRALAESILGVGVTEFSQELLSTVADLSSEFGITTEQAGKLVGAMREFANAGSVSEQVDAAAALNRQFAAAFGTIENIPPELREVAKQAGEIALRAADIEGATDDSTAAVEALGAAIASLPETFDPTITSAQTLAATLWDAAAALGATMQQMAIVDQASTGGRGGAGPGGPMGAAALFEASSGGINYGDFGASASTASGGGGGGGSLDGLQDDLAAMQERFMSEQELIDLAHDTELESLAEFRDAKLISMAEYNTLEEQLAAEHEEKLTEIQRAAQMARLSGWAGAFGDLSTLMSSENKKMQKIGEFAAKAQIGLEGIQSASSAWQKGMAIGGPPTAAAFAAMSVAKTAALMSQVGSSSGGASPGGTSSGTATSAAESGASNITNINANIAPNANYQGSVVTELFDMINQASADGNQIILRSV